KPILFSAKDKVEIVKGGSRITVRANAYDPDGDLINLYVCKGNSTVSSSGCGSDGEYGNSSSKINPRVSFNVENDNNEHKWYAYIFDQNGEGALNNGLEGNYTTDSTPPKTEIVSFASGLEQPYVDLQDDNKTLVVIKGEEGMKVRWGKDTRYRLHKDRSYNYLINNCNVSGEYAICNLGNLKKDDKSIDRITNLTYVYISAVDRYGNSQNNSENLNIAFSLELNTSIYDDYDGRILAKGENVFINGDTKYCIDQAGKCPPNLEINNNSIQFNESGIYHLRYYDYYAKIKDTLVFVNTPPNISNQTYIDHLGVHAFEVRVDVLDKDNQDLNCSLHTDTSVIPMTVENVKAYATLYSSNVSTISTFVSCGDGFEEVNTKTANHTFPNVAPILKNIPDISLNKNGSTAIDLSYLAKDLEGDNLNYSIVNQSNETIAKASISGDYLLVNASNKVGLSKVGLKAKDGVLDSNIEEINILVEDENESKLKNNEVTNTTVKLLSKVQYYNGSYLEEEYSKESYIKVLPGSINQLDLSKLFEWDSSKSSHIRGKFRVYFSAVDDNNITLVNRDGTNISAYYNFTLIYINTPPNLTGIPDKYVLINQKPDLINLFDYTKDKEQDLDSLNYSIVNQSNSSLINCSISNNYYINCSKPENTGISEINVSVFDGLLYDYDVFNIRVLPYSFLRKQNLTYTFLSSDFNLTG
ncbi:MAG: hypothetical protein ACE5J3_09515, partial [Methanosarcinales archaeon]